jgi:MOSC domain-containing protein YiiM
LRLHSILPILGGLESPPYNQGGQITHTTTESTMMQLIAVSIGQSQQVEYEGRTFSSAIFKAPVEGRLAVTPKGIDGDQQADRKHHGGRDKAMLVYAHEYYDQWSTLLNRTDLRPGMFGENLTVSGLTDDQVRLGDTLQIGETVVQVSQPRTPCYKLSARLNDSTVLKPYVERGMVGFYVRVLKTGTVGAGDAIAVLQRAEPSMTVRELSNLYHLQRDNVEGIRQAVQIESLADAWREPLLKRLDEHQRRA